MSYPMITLYPLTVKDAKPFKIYYVEITPKFIKGYPHFWEPETHNRYQPIHYFRNNYLVLED